MNPDIKPAKTMTTRRNLHFFPCFSILVYSFSKKTSNTDNVSASIILSKSVLFIS